MNTRRAGDSALLVEVDGLEAAHQLDATVRANAPPGVTDVVPGARTVLVVVDPARLSPQHLAAELATWQPAERPAGAGDVLEVPVTYDGADLAEVAGITGLTVEEVIDRHTSARHVVAFLGFAPGFGYIRGTDPALAVPRRSTPRTAVPAGSVALAGPYSAIYPRATPGGWRLIGRTGLVTWNQDRDPPALLRPGLAVRFVRGRA